MTCLCSIYDNDDLFRKLRPEHSAARDIAWGKFYGDRGAWNAIVQAERGGGANDMEARICSWRYRFSRIFGREHHEAMVVAGLSVKKKLACKR